MEGGLWIECRPPSIGVVRSAIACVFDLCRAFFEADAQIDFAEGNNMLPNMTADKMVPANTAWEHGLIYRLCRADPIDICEAEVSSSSMRLYIGLVLSIGTEQYSES